jgi:hypothetical protein
MGFGAGEMKSVVISLFIVLNVTLLHAEGLPYEIPPGDYYVWDSPVNIRDCPGLHGKVIGKLGLHDKFTVLSAFYDGDKYNYMESIDDGYQWWYRIKTENNLYGYIYGHYIAVKRVALDIDRNGIMDYFYLCYHVWGTIFGEFVSIDFPRISINNNWVDKKIFYEAHKRTTYQSPTEIILSTSLWHDAEFTNFQDHRDGRITIDIDFTISDLAKNTHHEVVTFDLTEYK